MIDRFQNEIDKPKKNTIRPTKKVYKAKGKSFPFRNSLNITFNANIVAKMLVIIAAM